MTPGQLSRRSFSLLLTAALAFGASAQDRNTTAYAFEQNQGLGRGLNILSADPMWTAPEKARMKDKHFAQIRAAGFGNVRIAVNPFRFAARDDSHALDPKFFVTLDWAVQEALKNKLMPIIDLHQHHEMGQDPLGTRGVFLASWRQIAAHYRDAPQEVLFEIANEPNMKPEIWNELQESARQIIRETNPQRTLIIGTVYGNQINYLKDLKLPDADRNIIVAVHYYSPIQFTHQGAPWSKQNKDLKNISWQATPAEQQAVSLDFDVAQAWSKAAQRPITLGEFGAYEKAALPHRVLWTDFVARQAEKRGWSWSYWQFDSDFIAYDLDQDRWFQPIRQALVPAIP
jgi:endoglucanase